MWTYIPRPQFHSSTFPDIPSLPWCLYSSCAARNAAQFGRVLTDTIDCGSLVTFLKLCHHLHTSYFIPPQQNCVFHVDIFLPAMLGSEANARLTGISGWIRQEVLTTTIACVLSACFDLLVLIPSSIPVSLHQLVPPH
jgi:hypothetical protein